MVGVAPSVGGSLIRLALTVFIVTLCNSVVVCHSDAHTYHVLCPVSYVEVSAPGLREQPAALCSLLAFDKKATLPETGSDFRLKVLTSNTLGQLKFWV